MLLKPRMLFRTLVDRTFIRKKYLHLTNTCCDAQQTLKEFCCDRLRMLDLDGNFQVTHLFETKLERIQKEVDSLKSSNFELPTQFSDHDLVDVLLLRTSNQRKIFYRLLRRLELNEATNADRMEFLDKRGHYVSYDKSIFLPDVHDRMVEYDIHNLIHANSYGQNLVVDLAYHDIMNRRNVKLCGEMLRKLFNLNKVKKDAFSFHFCNASDKLVRQLKYKIPVLQTDPPLATLTSKSYLEMFPVERLVYLTPDAEEDLNYSQHDIYIIGGLVEKYSKKRPKSMEKATQEGLRKAKLPVADYRHPVYGTNAPKILWMIEVLNILHAMKRSRDWNIAFREIPDYRFMPKEEDLPDDG